MKNFDEARNARRAEAPEFQLGGEIFRVNLGAHPDDLKAFGTITEETTIDHDLAVIDQVILSMIDAADGGHERYRALREQRADPIGFSDLEDLAVWLMEQQTARPTRQPGGSSAGRGRTGTTSKGASSSRVAARA